MTAREAVTGLLTAYLVSVLTLAWLAAVGGLLWLLGSVWGPVAEGALTWLRVWSNDLARAGIAAVYVVAGVAGVGVLLIPVMPLPYRGGRC